MNQQELDQALADLKAAVDLTTGAVRTTNDNLDSFSKSIAGKGIVSSLDKIAKDSVKVSQNVGKSLDGLLTASNTFKNKVNEINKALGGINFKGISQSVNSAAASMQGFSKAAKMASGAGGKPVDFTKLTVQTDSLTRSFANLQKTIDRMSTGKAGSAAAGPAGGGGGAPPPEAIDENAAKTKEELNKLRKSIVGAGGTLTQFVDTTERGSKANMAVTAALALTESALGGLLKSTMSYSMALLDGQRGSEVAAKASQEFTKALTTGAKDIGLAMAMMPGLGIAAKLAGLALAGVAKAAEILADLNVRAAKQADDLYKSFTELGKSSAVGAAGVTGIANNLKKLGMTTAELDKYNKLIGTNTKDMAMFGATTAQGADKFVEVAGTISNPASELGKKFQLLGITAEEQNEHTLKYMSMQARMGALQGKSTADLIKGASAYIEELDAMARLTGASRKEQEEGREFAMAENKLRAAMLAAQERGDKDEAAHLEKMAKVVANYAALGLKTEATGIAHMAASKGGVTSAEAARMSQAGINTEAMRGKSAEEATAMGMGQLKAQAIQLASQEAVGATNMMGSGMAKVLDADARMAKGGGTVPTGAGTKEQKAMTESPEERTKAMVEGMLKQQKLAVEIDQKLLDTLNSAKDITARYDSIATQMLTAFSTALDMLKTVKDVSGLSGNALEKILAGVAAVGGVVLTGLVTKLPGVLGGGAAAGGATAGGAGAAGGVMKYLGTAGKVLGKVAAPLAVASAGYDAYKGYNNAEETLGIKGRKATTGEKMASAAGGAISGLTFGLVSADTISKGIAKATGAGPADKEEQKKLEEAQIKADKENTEKTGKLSETSTGLIKSLDNLKQSIDKLTSTLVTGTSSGGGAKPSVPVLDASGRQNAASDARVIGGGGGGKPADMQSYLQATALMESGGKANAKAGTSSAAGLFQFTEGTWKQMTKEMGKDYSLEDRFDPKKSAEVMGYFTQKQKTQLEKGTGKDASNTDLYMAHFLGAGGATKFINAMNKDPNIIAAELDPKAAAANKSIFYDKDGRARTVQEVYSLMGNKMSGAEQAVQSGKWGGKALPETVASLGQVNVPQGNGGGLFSGPDSGYLVKMHGNEVAVPMADLQGRKMSDLSDVASKIANNTTGTDMGPKLDALIAAVSSNANKSSDIAMMELSSKLDEMIELLRKSSQTQEEQLQYVRA